MMSKFLGAVGVAAMLVCGQPAAAATLSYSYDFSMLGSYYGPPVTEQALFPTFDPALGKLRAFTAQVDVSYQYGAAWDQSAMERGVYYWGGRYEGWRLFVNLGGDNPNGRDIILSSLPAVDRDDGTFYGAGPGDVGAYDSGLITIHTIAGTVTGTRELELLSGNGQRYTQLDIEGLTVSQECLSATCGPMSTYGSAQHRVTLTYTYDAAVPEPAAWALMILGFGMLGGALRHRKSAAAV